MGQRRCYALTPSYCINHKESRARMSPPSDEPAARAAPASIPKLLEILVCPATHGPLEYDAAAGELISRKAGLAYPIRDGIPDHAGERGAPDRGRAVSAAMTAKGSSPRRRPTRAATIDHGAVADRAARLQGRRPHRDRVLRRLTPARCRPSICASRAPRPRCRATGPSQKKIVSGRRHVKIAAVEPVGHYAIRIVFDDRHDSGIYSWSYLRELGDSYAERWAAYQAALLYRGLSRDTVRPVMKIVIAGAGIGGLTAAMCLHRAGFDVEVFEAVSEMQTARRRHQHPGGRRAHPLGPGAASRRWPPPPSRRASCATPTVTARRSGPIRAAAMPGCRGRNSPSIAASCR